MSTARRTRVFIVDDSAVMRSLLRAVVSSDAGCEVAGVAADGKSALSGIEAFRPDVVLLDVEMPVMDGLKTLRQLRARGHKMPVIMCSSLTRRGARVTIEALACGASDYVAKPAGQTGPEAGLQSLSQDLLPKIHALAASSAPIPASSLPAQNASVLLTPEVKPPRLTEQPISAEPSIVAIGVSTGGPAALDVVLSALPASFPLPVLVVQHMPEVFTRLLAEHLNQRCALEVREAAEGDLIRPGTISIARGNWHLEVVQSHASRPMEHLTQAAPENHCRPAVDVLFRSAVSVYGAGVLAVVLTGMGSDGLAGSAMIREYGGCVLAQDQSSSAVWGMPGAVSNAGLANRVLPLKAIAPEILRYTGRRGRGARELRETVA